MRRPDEPHLLVLEGLAPEAGLSAVIPWAVAHAALAPSEHNSQPWRFRAVLHQDGSARLDLLLDQARLLAVVDPEAREAVLACGAALLNLRLALSGAGCGARVSLSPDPDRPELLARVEVGGRPLPADADDELRLAVILRGTHRGPFEATDVPADLVDRLVAEAAREGAFVTAVDDAHRPQLMALTGDAEQALWNDGEFHREAAAWARGLSSAGGDGVPGYAFGAGAVRSWLQPTLARTGRPTVSRADVVQAAADAPVLLAVGTPDDSPAAVLRAGQAMQRLLLRARAEGLAASYLNGALHVPALRTRLAASLGLPVVQVVLRLGYGPLARSTPRRGISDVLVIDADLRDGPLGRAGPELSRRADDEISRRADDEIGRRADDEIGRRADNGVLYTGPR